MNECGLLRLMISPAAKGLPVSIISYLYVWTHPA